LFTVLFEDTAAMLGLFVAFVGIAAADYLDMPLLDGVASIVIGLILALTASLLAFETKGLLIGEAAHPRVVEGVRRIARAEDSVIGINEILTMHLGPKDVLLNVSLDFGDKFTADDVEASVTNMERQIKRQFPDVTRVFIEAQSRNSQRRV